MVELLKSRSNLCIYFSHASFSLLGSPRLQYILLGTRSLVSFKAGSLATYRAVTSELNPPFLQEAPPVHTRSFALAVRRSLNKLALPELTAKGRRQNFGVRVLVQDSDCNLHALHANRIWIAICMQWWGLQVALKKKPLIIRLF